MIALRGYIDEQGKQRFADWLDGIDSMAAAKVTIALTRMELGNFSNVKGVGAGVFEYKIDFGPGYRSRLSPLLRQRWRYHCDPDRRWHEEAPATGHNCRPGMLGKLQTKKEAGAAVMALTHDFKGTIRARAQRDPDFRQALLRNAVECMLNGELGTGKAVLRDYVNATLGFQNLEKFTQIPAKSLMRMLGPKGSPSVANLSSILTALQETEGVHFELSLRR